MSFGERQTGFKFRKVGNRLELEQDHMSLPPQMHPSLTALRSVQLQLDLEALGQQEHVIAA